MTENITTPYIIQISEPVQTIRYSGGVNNIGIQFDPLRQELITMNNSQILLQQQGHALNSDNVLESNPWGVIDHTESLPPNYKMVTQQEQPCILQIVYPQDLSLSPAQNMVKRGRPKKKKQDDPPPLTNIIKTEQDTELPRTARTRSGRLVKLPKHIEKDFKKIEIASEEQELQVSDFKRFEEKENSKTEFTEVHRKRRVISAQFRCPKCGKAYLGKPKMIQHLKKNPDHGPLPEGYQQHNFDVWNYLFDITQKCSPGQRGNKFCEELSNLLHNVQLLKSALFKNVHDGKNCVQIDKVLGGAIGLQPGKYQFDENELYKDVTVLKLITNSDFFKPNVNKHVIDNMAANNKNHSPNVDIDHCVNKKKKAEEIKAEKEPESNFKILKNVTEAKPTELVYNFIQKPKDKNTAPKRNENQIADGTQKKMEVDNPIPTDLLTENLLLHSLPNPRHSHEELMLTSVDNTSNLLDNSTSSDEVMNVDQFVNERFKKIIEPDIELSNASLNLDLPSLELFQFHTS